MTTTMMCCWMGESGLRLDTPVDLEADTITLPKLPRILGPEPVVSDGWSCHGKDSHAGHESIE